MKKPRNTKGLLEALLVIGLILIIPLFFVMRTAAEQNTAQNTAVSLPTAVSAPVRPTAANAPADSNALKPKQPPACTFPLANIEAVEPQPEEYTFSEPQVVLTEPDNLYDIVEWLPDNQRVLMTQEIRDNSSVIIQQSIELCNPQTGETQVYAIRNQTIEPPSWQPELNAVVYPDTNVLDIDKINNRYDFTRQIRVSHGNPHATELIADNLPQFYIAVKPGGNEMVYLSDKKISKLDKSLKNTLSAPFNPAQWDYSKIRNEFPVSYKMAWQPDSPLIFLYTHGDLGGGYTFILDSNTGQICELNLNGWVFKAHWSSNGRYLAIARTQGSFPIDFSDLVVLDSMTGDVYTIAITPEEIVGKHYVIDLAWAPDNQHLLAIGSVFPFQNTNPVDSDKNGLYLVDFISGQSVNLLPTYKFYANTTQSNLAWSSDGSKLLVRCPTIEDERICFISVQRSGQ